MGYNLYITRARSWLDSHESPIPKADWDAVVEADPELAVSLEEWWDQEINGQVERIHPVIWKHNENRVPFWFFNGAVETKNPERAAVRKMVQLAANLTARVVGEGDEEYGPDGEPLKRRR